MNMRVEAIPANIEAEQAVLGGLLMNNGARLPSTFEPEHFFEPVHAEIYKAFRKGIAAGKSVNPISIRSFMSPEVQSAKVGNMTMTEYIVSLFGNVVNIVNIPDLADAVTDAYHRRCAITASEDARLACLRAADELEFASEISACRNKLNAILSSIAKRTEPEDSFFDAIDQTLEKTADAMAGRSSDGLDPGIPEIAALTGKWQPGQLIIIGGDVKQGKSALAWQIFFNLAESYPVAGFSGEMPKSQIIMREKARRTGISAKRQKLGQVSDSEVQELLNAGEQMKKLNFMDIDCRQMTLEQLDQRIERLKAERGIMAFVVDHILKLSFAGKMEDADDFKKANKATSTLKNMAMKHGVVIVALTHLNKSGYADFSGRNQSFKQRLESLIRRKPTYKNLLGNIDKDADHALIVFQPRPLIIGMEPEEHSEDYAVWETYMEMTKGKAEVILSLSREGEPSRRELQWNGATTSYGPSFKQAKNNERLL